MRKEFYFPSQGEGNIRCCRWIPEGEVRAVVQILHGIAEHVERYDHFARFLNEHGFAVVAHDHMGHGKSLSEETTRGYFTGGWFAAVADSVKVTELTQEEFPGIPYILFGHSMGSFLARTILAKYPQLKLTAAVICGTGWMPELVIRAGKTMAGLICKKGDERKPNDTLHGMMFGGYNKRIEHPRTPSDWLSRDDKVVDAYVADPLCGFPASAGLARDMLGGMLYIQQKDSLAAMNKQLPVFFIAGGDDPVGDYGDGVRLAAEKFQKAGMEDVSVRIYPLCRHEILNELNKEEVYEDVVQWMERYIR